MSHHGTIAHMLDAHPAPRVTVVDLSATNMPGMHAGRL